MITAKTKGTNSLFILVKVRLCKYIKKPENKTKNNSGYVGLFQINIVPVVVISIIEGNPGPAMDGPGEWLNGYTENQ